MQKSKFVATQKSSKVLLAFLSSLKWEMMDDLSEEKRTAEVRAVEMKSPLLFCIKTAGWWYCSDWLEVPKMGMLLDILPAPDTGVSGSTAWLLTTMQGSRPRGIPWDDVKSGTKALYPSYDLFNGKLLKPRWSGKQNAMAIVERKLMCKIWWSEPLIKDVFAFLWVKVPHNRD